MHSLIVLEDGLALHYAYLSSHEKVELVQLPRRAESETGLSVCFLLPPSAIKLVLTDRHSMLPLSANHIFLASNNAKFSIRIPEETFTHWLMVLMTQAWLRQNLTGMEEKIRSIEQFLVESPDAVLTDKLRPAASPLLEQVVSEQKKSKPNVPSLRAGVLLLLSATIGQWPAPAASRPTMLKAWHVQTIHQVEERLLQSLEDTLPSQKQLAREFALSESTLKRHFKAVYGRTMYDYYLQKKMELAKRLIQEKKITVTETAYRLGYEKVSAFISMFKKVHKVLPGSLK
jgi:AraC-like DNA-binding protein